MSKLDDVLAVVKKLKARDLAFLEDVANALLARDMPLLRRTVMAEVAKRGAEAAVNQSLKGSAKG